MRKTVIGFLISLALLTYLVVYFNLPTTKVSFTSELIMLGDLDNNLKWDSNDVKQMNEFVKHPFNYDKMFVYKLDLNNNRKIDIEDTLFLSAICSNEDIYSVNEEFNEKGLLFPKPRDFFRYLPATEYIQRPLYTLRHPIASYSPFKSILDTIIICDDRYESSILSEIYDECLHLTFRYLERKGSLSEVETEYAEAKFETCKDFYRTKRFYELLLTLIGLVEDSETLSINNQTKFIREILFFREHLRELLQSELYDEFSKGVMGYDTILSEMEKDLKNDCGLIMNFNQLESPRNFTNLQNYLDRAEWQSFKSKTKDLHFERLVLFAQYDRRYLRAVANTSRKHKDKEVKNHNLPMILLYREALNIMGGDRKAAVGMLDEAIRIPFQWIKSIPRDMLPSSIALNNFLLPGNKEDGADKSRHWNVFGGLSIYRSPEESLQMSIKREITDLRDNDYSVEAMDEFIRDLISNINGIYYVSSISDYTNIK